MKIIDLIFEDSDGKAKASQKGYIDDFFLEDAEKIVKDCPEKAISIIEVSNTSLKGKDGLLNLKIKLYVEM